MQSLEKKSITVLTKTGIICAPVVPIEEVIQLKLMMKLMVLFSSMKFRILDGKVPIYAWQNPS